MADKNTEQPILSPFQAKDIYADADFPISKISTETIKTLIEETGAESVIVIPFSQRKEGGLHFAVEGANTSDLMLLQALAYVTMALTVQKQGKKPPDIKK